MCTLITTDTNSPELEKRIRADAVSNSDGWSLLMLDKNGTHTFTRTLSLETLVNLINGQPWARIFLHSRFATQGSKKLQNCHGWDADGYFYFHNGVLRSPEARVYAVDSQLIGKWLRKHGARETMTQLVSESFANVLVCSIDKSEYWAFHSRGGSLYADGKGNFSTNAFGDINIPCKSDHYYYNQLPRMEEKKPVKIYYGRDWESEDWGTFHGGGRFKAGTYRGLQDDKPKADTPPAALPEVTPLPTEIATASAAPVVPLVKDSLKNSKKARDWLSQRRKGDRT